VRLSHLTLDLTAQDLTELVRDFSVEDKIMFDTITEDGIRGRIKLMVWSVDFVAVPSCTEEGEVSIDITAHKLVQIPPGIVERQLREAVKDAPAGIGVLQQALKVHLPSLLSPLGISMTVRQLKCYDGFLRIALARVQLPPPGDLMALGKRRTNN
jgi:hypothetical protein